MKKEEQQENLYQLLFQRNQFNSEIIRKYRKKSMHYLKRISEDGKNLIQGTDWSGIATLIKEQNQEHIYASQLASVCNKYEQEERDEEKDQIDEGSEQYGGQKWKIKQETKFPQINNPRTEICPNISCSMEKTDRNKLNIQRQISMALNYEQESKNINRQSLSVGSEDDKVNEENISKSCNMKNGQIKTLKNQSIASNSSNGKIDVVKIGEVKNFRHPTLQSSLHKTNNNFYGNIRRETKLTNSHKALLNLQQITFESNDTKNKNKQQKYIVHKDREKVKQIINKERSKSKTKNNRNPTKYRRYQQYYRDQGANLKNNYYKGNLDAQYIGRVESLTNITNFINNISIGNSVHSIMGSSKNIYMGSMHNNYSNGKNGIQNTDSNRMKANQKRNTNNTHHSHNSIEGMPNILLSSNKQGIVYNNNMQQNSASNNGYAITSSSLNNNMKNPQMLPHLRKLKQFKLSFQRLVKKQCLNTYQNTSLNNAKNGHNYGNTGSSILNAYNSTYTNFNSNTIACTGNVGIGCRDDLLEIQNENNKRLFKIQAIPVHQIKWF